MRITEKNAPFSNPLSKSESIYLRQHSTNPVYWYPWGEAALTRAKEENKPILLSIGYSSCYWCHVMEREVFENLSIASQMNRCFINIKVDREEHPQIDEIYMHARQIMTHEGGWPNNVFLTPDLKPFYAGGTYGATEIYGKPAFPRLIEWLHHSWVTEEDNVRKIADETTEMLKNFMVTKKPATLAEDFSPMIIAARSALGTAYDAKAGGFHKAPKFPHEGYLQFLMQHYRTTGNRDSLDMAVHTLGQMAAGGINDQVGCGFHRYAVDKDWMVPHFEKMLYTQGMLARSYTEAAELTGNEYLADVARSICEFVIATMRDQRGGFYSAIDAETGEVEGAFYAWSPKEIEALLTPDELAFFLHHYALAEIPHFSGHKHPQGDVLVARMPLFQAALAQKMPYMQVAALAGQVMNKLLAVRNQRERPMIDTKMIVSWNGLMIDGMAHAGKVFGKRAYIEHARKAADYLLRHAFDDKGELQRCLHNHRAGQPATLEDYAYFIRALLTLNDAQADGELLKAAIYLTTKAEELFGDNYAPGLFTTQIDDVMIVRPKSGDDSTLPSANAVMADNYLVLAEATGDEAYKRKAHDIVQFFLSGDNRMWIEYASMARVAMKLQGDVDSKAHVPPQLPTEAVVEMTARLNPHTAKPGDKAQIIITLNILPGWHIRPWVDDAPDPNATRIAIQSDGVKLLNAHFPKPSVLKERGGELEVYQNTVTVVAISRFRAISVRARKSVSCCTTSHAAARHASSGAWM